MRSSVAKCPKHALDQVHQTLVLTALALRPQGIEGQAWCSCLSYPQRFIYECAAVRIEDCLFAELSATLLVASNTA